MIMITQSELPVMMDDNAHVLAICLTAIMASTRLGTGVASHMSSAGNCGRIVKIVVVDSMDPITTTADSPIIPPAIIAFGRYCQCDDSPRCPTTMINDNTDGNPTDELLSGDCVEIANDAGHPSLCIHPMGFVTLFTSHRMLLIIHVWPASFLVGLVR
jgi:hypothetical protein